MIDGEMMRFMREEIKRQVNVILSGSSGNNTQFIEDIQNQYPGSPPVPGRPVMHPYGFASRAPANTIQVIARVGDHPGNRMVLGHRDSARPLIGSGETILYNQYGQQIYLEKGKIHIGTKATSDPAPIGNELKAYILAELGWILTHTHVSSAPGAPTSPPSEASALQEIQANNIDNDKILSKTVFIDPGGG